MRLHCGANGMAIAVPPCDDEDPIDIAPGRRVGAIAWVLIVAAAMLVMCLAAVLTFAFFMVRASLH